MEDSKINSVELEEGITTNVPEVAEIEVAAPEAVESPEPKNLRDAVMKAFEKNTDKEVTTADTASTEPAKEVDPISGREIEPIRAPSTMTPTLREKWGTVPREYQKFWVDRERDMQVKLQETADQRKLAKDFHQAAEPYQDTFRQNGVSAVEHAKDLFSMSHQLHTGNAQQKAQIIHKLMVQFQPDAQTLSHLFNGGQVQPVQSAQPVPSVDELVNQRLQAREAEQQQAAIQASIDQFKADPRYEFTDDLGELMGKAIEAGFVKGDDFPTLFRNAYEFAANQHPEVKQILANRAAANPVVQVPAKTQKAVQSVKPSLASNGRGGQTQPRPKSLREAAELAWNKHTGE
jgi:hypothetical protein